jgi:hypothetical protein
MIPGIKLQMGGQDWLVPPLTLGQLRRLEPKLRAMADIPQGAQGMTAEQIDTIAEVVATAMSRNYPDMTNERVLELIDVGNARAVVLAVLTGSGLQLGEAAAVARPNGVTSMGSSPPRADTPTQ